MCTFFSKKKKQKEQLEMETILEDARKKISKHLLNRVYPMVNFVPPSNIKLDQPSLKITKVIETNIDSTLSSPSITIFATGEIALKVPYDTLIELEAHPGLGVNVRLFRMSNHRLVATFVLDAEVDEFFPQDLIPPDVTIAIKIRITSIITPYSASVS